MTLAELAVVAGPVCVLGPAVLVAALGMPALLGRPLGERVVAHLTRGTVLLGLAACVGVRAIMWATGSQRVSVGLGEWVALPGVDLHFQLKLVFDALSVPFALLTFVLVGTIGAFADRYLHREPGYGRFFLLYALFLLGMVLASLAGTIETLLVGWELVGFSSALLVAYFHERTATVRNGQRVWSIYRLGDAAFLVAAIALHHTGGGGDFERMAGDVAWPGGVATLTSGQALLVGSLLLVAAAAKSALVPFSGWLPRAMEGPTPSSAVFYGALSVHLGLFLLLRTSPLLEQSVIVSALLAGLGAATALVASLCASAQADAKGSLAFSSLVQVGLIAIEIALGLRVLALVHILGHACLRALQLLRAPNLLHDDHAIENAIGCSVDRAHRTWVHHVPRRWQRTLYRLALDHGALDTLLDRVVVEPFQAVFRACDRWEARWMRSLSGERTPDDDEAGRT